MIISTRTTARLLHDLLSLRRFKFIDWKEFVGHGRERRDCSLPLFVDIFWGAAAAIDLHVSEKLILPREREHENQAFWQHQSLQEYFCSM